MSTTVLERAEQATPARTSVAPIPFGRVVGVELRKMFDTRSGFWLMTSIAVLAVLATGAVIAFAPDDAITFDNFAAAIGVPMSVILPVIAVLSVTGEHTQRTGLTTYTLVPHRGRVVAAKAAGVAIIGVAGMLVALGVGALGNLLGSSITGVDASWNVSAVDFAYIVLAMLLTMAVGFMLGLLIRNSPGAVVAYFVYSFVVPGLLGTLAAFQGWFKDLQPWVDFNFASTKLFDGALSGQEWTQLAVTGVIWLVVPLAVGLRMTLRSEVK
jgi:ABC-type transport system involved in multi-copper enzyme maturation permease subunit